MSFDDWCNECRDESPIAYWFVTQSLPVRCSTKIEICAEGELRIAATNNNYHHRHEASCGLVVSVLNLQVAVRRERIKLQRQSSSSHMTDRSVSLTASSNLFASVS